MREIDLLIEDDVSGYSGPHAELIRLVPAIYRLMCRLLEDPLLPGRLRPLVLTVIGYFVIPSEIISEDLHGPAGYQDDLFLCAWVAERIRQELDTDDILLSNWDGDVPVMPLLASILSQEEALIGDHRELIFWYVGYEYLEH